MGVNISLLSSIVHVFLMCTTAFDAITNNLQVTSDNSFHNPLSLVVTSCVLIDFPYFLFFIEHLYFGPFLTPLYLHICLVAASYPRVAKCILTLGRFDSYQDFDYNSIRSPSWTESLRERKDRVASFSRW